MAMPKSQLPPWSQITRPRTAVSVPSERAPASSSITCPGAGFVAVKSSMRVIARRTGRRSASVAAATSGSTTISLPPNAPPSGAGRTRMRSSGRPSRSARLWRVGKAPCVLVLTTSSPSGSSHAVAVCGSR